MVSEGKEENEERCVLIFTNVVVGIEKREFRE
jgi:hypothetical protein